MNLQLLEPGDIRWGDSCVYKSDKLKAVMICCKDPINPTQVIVMIGEQPIAVPREYLFKVV